MQARSTEQSKHCRVVFTFYPIWYGCSSYLGLAYKQFVLHLAEETTVFSKVRVRKSQSGMLWLVTGDDAVSYGQVFYGDYLYFCNAWCIYTGYSGRTTESWAMHVLLHLLENRLGLRRITGNSIRRPGVLCSVSFWDEHRKQAFCVGMNCIVKEQGSSISRMSQGTKSSYIKASKSRLVTRSTQTSPTLPENSTQKYTHDRFSKNKILAWKQQ